MKTCPKCGTNNADAVRFCGNCGTDLANVASTPGSSQGLAALKVSPALIAFGASVLLMGLCLLIVIVASLVDDSPDETLVSILRIITGLSQLYALLLAFGGAWLLVSRLNLAQLFPSPDVLVRFLVILVLTGLLYGPLSFLMALLFAFGPPSPPHEEIRPLAISAVDLLQGILVVLVMAAIFFLLRRKTA